MPQVTINLPSITGKIEAGITVGVNASLPDEKKLPILIQAGKPAIATMIKNNAIIWGLSQFHEVAARELFLNGIAAAIDLGLICTHAGTVVPDGDWEISSIVLPMQEEMAAVVRLITHEKMKVATTVIVATKANYWTMNHHTGQGAVQGHVKKVLDIFYKDRVTDSLVSAAHNLGKFVSTLKVLSIAGIESIRGVTPIVESSGAGLTLSSDDKLKYFGSMPAGTHRLAIAYEAGRRLLRNVHAPLCPDIQDFIAIPPKRMAVLAARASYHISASYLTGEARADYSDTENERYLGRLGTFITTEYKHSILAKSPHLAISKVEGYDDYDANFKTTLIKVQLSQRTAKGRTIEEIIEPFRAHSEEQLQAVRQAFGINRPRMLSKPTHLN